MPQQDRKLYREPHEGSTSLGISPRGVFEGLSDRALRVIKLLSEGLTGLEIAGHIGVTQENASVYQHRLVQRLRLANKLHLIGEACRTGIFDNPLNVDAAQPEEINVAMRQQLQMLSDGVEVSQIATLFGTSSSYIINRSSFIRRRLGAQTTAHAIRIANEVELLPADTSSVF